MSIRFDDVDNINVRDSVFVLTGNFSNGSKEHITDLIETNQGIVRSEVSSVTDYLVVGDLGEIAWTYGEEGGVKVKKANEIRDNKGRILIITEDKLMSALIPNYIMKKPSNEMDSSVKQKTNNIYGEEEIKEILNQGIQMLKRMSEDLNKTINRTRDLAAIKSHYGKYHYATLKEKELRRIFKDEYMKEICNLINDKIGSYKRRFEVPENIAPVLSGITMINPDIYEDEQLVASVKELESERGILNDDSIKDLLNAAGLSKIQEEGSSYYGLQVDFSNEIITMEKIPYSETFAKYIEFDNNFARDKEIAFETGMELSEDLFVSMIKNPKSPYRDEVKDDDYNIAVIIINNYLFYISEMIGEYLIEQMVNPFEKLARESFQIASTSLVNGQKPEAALLSLHTMYITISQTMIENCLKIIHVMIDEFFNEYEPDFFEFTKYNYNLVESWANCVGEMNADFDIEYLLDEYIDDYDGENDSDSADFNYRQRMHDYFESIGFTQLKPIDYFSLDKESCLEILKIYYAEVTRTISSIKELLFNYEIDGNPYKDVSLSIFIDIYKKLYNDPRGLIYIDSEGSEYRYEVIDDYVRIIEYLGDSVSVMEVPESIEGKKVRIIGKEAFCDIVFNEIHIPKTIKEIEENAFSLEIESRSREDNTLELKLEEGLEIIGDFAFMLNNIERLSLPDSINQIGKGAFSFNKINSIKLPMKIRTIEEGAFTGNQIKTLQLPPSIIHVGNFSFSHNLIEELELSDKVEEIGPSAFSNNSISHIQVPGNVKRIGDSAFSTNKIEKLTLHDGVEWIGKEAFSDNMIRVLQTPSSLKYLGNESFQYNLVSEVDFAEGLEYIGENLFGSHTADIENGRIDVLILPGSVKKIGKETFSECRIGTLILNEGLEEIEDYSFHETNIKVLILPNSLKTIGKFSFYDNDITELVLPERCKLIDEGAFGYNQIEKLDVPGSVKTIGRRAFFSNKIEELRLGVGVSIIEESAFGSNRISKLEIPESVKNIADLAFEGNQIDVLIPNEYLLSLEDLEIKKIGLDITSMTRIQKNTKFNNSNHSKDISFEIPKILFNNHNTFKRQDLVRFYNSIESTPDLIEGLSEEQIETMAAYYSLSKFNQEYVEMSIVDFTTELRCVFMIHDSNTHSLESLDTNNVESLFYEVDEMIKGDLKETHSINENLRVLIKISAKMEEAINYISKNHTQD